jgi:phosphate transport system substrate-binding protein
LYTNKRRYGVLAMLLTGSLVIAGCGSDDDGGSGSGDGGDTISASSPINVDGSSTVAPLAEVAAELFMDANDVQVAVATSGTSGGFQKFCLGETDMNNASRAIKESEIEACESNDIAYEGIQIANDALSLIVHPDNPLECLTVEQANQIWEPDSGVSTWGDIDGVDAGDLAGDSVKLYGPGTDSGTFDFFTEAINGEEGAIRTDYTDIGEDDQAAITAVRGDTAAMGYIPFSFVQEAGDSVKALQIDGGEGCIEGTLENVQDGSYAPLGRPLFTYASDKALARPEVVAFMEFWIENSDAIAEAAIFVPMTQEQKDEGFAKIETLTGG